MSYLKDSINERKEGFTIIEVVLVLAIAGLIMAMVFIALPALQRAERNKERMTIINNISASVLNYRTHNSNQTPWGNTNPASLEENKKFIQHYVDPDAEFDWQGKITNCGTALRDPSGQCYNLLPGFNYAANGVATGVIGSTITPNNAPSALGAPYQARAFNGVECISHDNINVRLTKEIGDIALIFNTGEGYICSDLKF